MKIKIDYNFCLESVIGEEGILYKDLEELKDTSQKIHERIINEKNNDIIGFYKLPFLETSDIKEKVKKFKNNFKNCVVLGIGGSALGSIAVLSALKDYFEENNLFVIDNIDPEVFFEFINKIDINETFFTVISKSGSTAETISEFLIIRDLLIKRLGFESYKKRILIITDPEKGVLREIVNKENLDNLSVPENVGGRFSVLSPVGLFPLAFAGIDIDFLLEGAIYFSNYLTNNGNIFENKAYLLGAIHYVSYNKGKTVNVFMPYSTKLYRFADWFRQLWAESLGKNTKGALPVKALGATDQHSQLQLYMDGPKDKLITFLKVEKFKNDILIPEQDIHNEYEYLMNKNLCTLLNNELDATRVALAKNGVMNYMISIESINPFLIGELIFMFEVMTHYTGYLFDINPFNQPGVEESKHYTYAMMNRKGFEHIKKDYINFLNKCSEKYII